MGLAPNPYPDAVGSLEEFGEKTDGRVQARAEQEGDEVRRPDRGQPHHPHVDRGTVAISSNHEPESRQDEAERDESERRERAPSPLRPSATATIRATSHPAKASPEAESDPAGSCVRENSGHHPPPSAAIAAPDTAIAGIQKSQ